ncbi:MAG: type II 3-dehydroquinate dehydratase [Proteobacteria bacterium]|nr:type II 3-dehydroquinate dehydratase [Pseudomonadota bacterium]
MNITVLNGPNLNLLGQREPEIYGSIGLSDIQNMMLDNIKNTKFSMDFLQSNKEYELVEKIQSLMHKKDQFIIINPAAFTHTSVAIRDALQATNIPFIEVHLSNVYAREDFRKKSYFSDIAVGKISGLGADGYLLALKFIINNY